MKKFIVMVCLSFVLVGCTSNDSNNNSTGNKKVSVSQSEANALSALSNIKGNSADAKGVGRVSLKPALLR